MSNQTLDVSQISFPTNWTLLAKFWMTNITKNVSFLALKYWRRFGHFQADITFKFNLLYRNLGIFCSHFFWPQTNVLIFQDGFLNGSNQTNNIVFLLIKMIMTGEFSKGTAVNQPRNNYFGNVRVATCRKFSRLKMFILITCNKFEICYTYYTCITWFSVNMIFFYLYTKIMLGEVQVQASKILTENFLLFQQLNSPNVKQFVKDN